MLSYWAPSQAQETEYLEAILRQGPGPGRTEPWPYPQPPTGCKFALTINALDFFLIDTSFLMGTIKPSDILAYQDALPPGAKVWTDRNLENDLRVTLSKSSPHMTLYQLENEPIDASQSSQIDEYLSGLKTSQIAEPGTFTLDPSAALSKDKKLFANPYSSFFRFVEQYLGAAGSTQFETDATPSFFSTIHSAQFDGTAPAFDHLAKGVEAAYLTGRLEDPTTWAAAIALAIREIPDMVELQWLTPEKAWTFQYEKNGTIRLNHKPIKKAIRNNQTIQIKLRHRFLAETSLLWSKQFRYPSCQYYRSELYESPIISLEGTEDFQEKDIIYFDRPADMPYSLVINQLGPGHLIFYLNRCPIHLPSPLPCSIHVFGAKLQSDLSKVVSPSPELQAQVLRHAAPFVHEALLQCCREGGHDSSDFKALNESKPEGRRLSLEPTERISNQFRHYLKKNHLVEEEGPYLREQASIDILLDHIHLSTYGGEKKSLSQWRLQWGKRLVLASPGQNRFTNTIDPSDVLQVTPSMLEFLRFLFPNQILARTP